MGKKFEKNIEKHKIHKKKNKNIKKNNYKKFKSENSSQKHIKFVGRNTEKNKKNKKEISQENLISEDDRLINYYQKKLKIKNKKRSFLDDLFSAIEPNESDEDIGSESDSNDIYQNSREININHNETDEEEIVEIDQLEETDDEEEIEDIKSLSESFDENNQVEKKNMNDNGEMMENQSSVDSIDENDQLDETNMELDIESSDEVENSSDDYNDDEEHSLVDEISSDINDENEIHNGENNFNASGLIQKIRVILNVLKQSNIGETIKNLDNLFCEYSLKDYRETLCNLCSSWILKTSNEQVIINVALLVSCIHIRKMRHMNFAMLIIERIISDLNEKYPTNEWKLQYCTNISTTYLFLLYLLHFGIITSDILIDLLNEATKYFKLVHVKVIQAIITHGGCLLKKNNTDRYTEFVENYKTTSQKYLSKLNAQNELRCRAEDTIEKLNIFNQKKFDFFQNSNELFKIFRNATKSYDTKNDPIYVRLSDFSNDNSNKWWHVGRGVNPNITVVTKSNQNTQNTQNNCDYLLNKFSNDEIELSKKIGFKTPFKQFVFCKINSMKDDCENVDILANEIMDLKSNDSLKQLKTNFEKEVADVIIKCVILDTEFNEFYPFLLIELTRRDRNYRQLIRCCIWDWYNKGTLVTVAMSNLGRCCAQLVIFHNRLFKGSIIKHYDFSSDKDSNVVFMVSYLDDLFAYGDERSIGQIMQQISDETKSSFVRKLSEFIKTYIQSRPNQKNNVTHLANYCIGLFNNLF